MNMKFSYNDRNLRRGFAHLLGVLIIAIVGISIVIVLLTLTASIIDAEGVGVQSAQARAGADTCAEFALEHLRNDDAYEGTETPALDIGECTSVVTNTTDGDGNRSIVIQSTGAMKGATRRVLISATITYPPAPDAGVFAVNSWQEVAGF